MEIPLADVEEMVRINPRSLYVQILALRGKIMTGALGVPVKNVTINGDEANELYFGVYVGVDCAKNNLPNTIKMPERLIKVPEDEQDGVEADYFVGQRRVSFCLKEVVGRVYYFHSDPKSAAVLYVNQQPKACPAIDADFDVRMQRNRNSHLVLPPLQAELAPEPERRPEPVNRSLVRELVPG